ncbi:hypothetical protein KI387_023595, partial [Taxus chinensis]
MIVVNPETCEEVKVGEEGEIWISSPRNAEGYLGNPWLTNEWVRMICPHAYEKVVVSVDMFCEKCKRKVMKTASKIEGVDSIEVDASKSTVTIIGDVDPVELTIEMRKFRKSARI